MKTIIHVNRQLIAANIKRPNDPLPVYTVKQGESNTYGYGVNILGPSTLVDIRDSEQLVCGARAWIETNADVEIVNPMTWQQVQDMKKE